MARKVIYWLTTGLLGAMGLFAGFAYLSGSADAVTGFAHVGYPQQLRVLLGIRQAARRHRPPHAWLASSEGVGVRRLHIRLDRGDRCALSR